MERLRKGLPRWLVTIVTLVVALVSAGIIIMLIKRSTDSHDAQLALSGIEEKAIHISALEWQGIAVATAGEQIPAGIPGNVEQENDGIVSQLATLDSLTHEDSRLGQLHLLHDNYVGEVRSEIALLQAGNLQQARILDEQSVDPGYLELEDYISSLTADYSEAAGESVIFAYLGSALTALAAAILVSILFWRYDRQRSAIVLAEAEKRALTLSEEHFRSLVQNSSDVIMIVSPEGEITFVSPSARRVLAYDPVELSGTNLVQLAPPQRRKPLAAFLSRCALARPGEAPAIEIPFRFGDGRRGYLEVICNNRLDDPAMHGIVLNARDVSERKRTEEVLRSMSLVDDLTGLYNRRGFRKLAAQLLRHAHRTRSEVQLLFVDLDDLKWINDTFGHAVGDEALQDVAAACRDTFRESDIIGRYAGDEFVIMAVDTSAGSVQKLVERLQENAEKRNERKREFRLSFSIGRSACVPPQVCTIDEMLARADESMYEQKKEKKTGS